MAITYTTLYNIIQHCTLDISLCEDGNEAVLADSFGEDVVWYNSV